MNRCAGPRLSKIRARSNPHRHHSVCPGWSIPPQGGLPEQAGLSRQLLRGRPSEVHTVGSNLVVAMPLPAVPVPPSLSPPHAASTAISSAAHIASKLFDFIFLLRSKGRAPSGEGGFRRCKVAHGRVPLSFAATFPVFRSALAGCGCLRTGRKIEVCQKGKNPDCPPLVRIIDETRTCDERREEVAAAAWVHRRLAFRKKNTRR